MRTGAASPSIWAPSFERTTRSRTGCGRLLSPAHPAVTSPAPVRLTADALVLVWWCAARHVFVVPPQGIHPYNQHPRLMVQGNSSACSPSPIAHCPPARRDGRCLIAALDYCHVSCPAPAIMSLTFKPLRPHLARAARGIQVKAPCHRASHEARQRLAHRRRRRRRARLACDSMHLYILNGIRCTRCPSLRVNLRRQGP